MVSSDESCSERDRLRVSSLGFPSRVLLERSGTNERDVRRIATYAKPFTRFDLVSNLTCSMSMFAACIVSDCFFASTFVSASVQAQLRRPVSSDLRLPSLLAVTVIDVFFPSRRVVGVSSVPPRRFFRDVVLAVSLLSSNPSFVLRCRSIPTFRSDPSLPPPSTSRASLPFHCRVLPRPLHLLLPSPPPTNAPWSASQAGAGARFGAPERVRSDCTRLTRS